MIRLMPWLIAAAACTAPGMRSLHAPPQETAVPIHPACEPSNLGERGPEAPDDVNCRDQQRRDQTWRAQLGVFSNDATLVFTGDAGVRAHRGDETVWREVGAGPLAVAEAAKAACDGGCDGAVFLGDNLYKSGVNNPDDTAFLKAFATAWSWAGPQWYAQGNHDWGTYPRVMTNRTHKAPARDRAQRLFRDLRWLSADDTLDLRGDSHFWGTAAGPGRLVALDSNYLVRRCKLGKKGVRCKGDPRGKTTDRIAVNDLVERNVAGAMGPMVVVGHHPWVSNGEHGAAGAYKDVGRTLWRGQAWQHVLDTTVKPSSPLYLSGHDHNTQVARIDDGTLAVVVGAGGKTTAPGEDTAPGQERHEERVVQESYCDLGFAVVRVEADALTVDVHTIPHPDQSDEEMQECLTELAERRPELSASTQATCARYRWTSGTWAAKPTACSD